MERGIFPHEDVFRQLRDDFVLVAQYTDDKNDPQASLNLQAYTKDGGYAVPLYIVSDSSGEEIARLTPPGNIASLSTATFAAFLESAKAKYATGG